jgi:hypothetical protein
VRPFVLRHSTQLDDKNIISTIQTTNLISSYKYSQFMLRPNSLNQFVLSYLNDNKKQTTIVNSSYHLKPNVNYLRSTQTYTSYFLLFFYITKYYKLVVCTSGDSVKSDQTYIYYISLKMLTLKASEKLDHLCIKTGPLVIITQHNLNAADIKNCACLFEPPQLVVQNINSSHTKK